jgi:hypothetical protein
MFIHAVCTQDDEYEMHSIRQHPVDFSSSLLQVGGKRVLRHGTGSINILIFTLRMPSNGINSAFWLLSKTIKAVFHRTMVLFLSSKQNISNL